nr:integrase arm-type DNA-binding domain-containing protein [Hydrogenophaga sp.]
MTRYPKAGKGKKWTTLELKAMPPEWRGDTLSDGDGLIGEVRVANDQSVSARFKFAFRWEGKVAWYPCGTWPNVSMEQIRRLRDEARDLVRSGVNPNDQKKAERIENQAAVEATIAQAAAEASQNRPFKDMFDAWLADGVARKDGNAELRRSFEKDVLPVLGDKPVRSITEHDLRKVLRTMVARGVN